MATACTRPPAGRARWTLELLAGQMVALTAHAGLSRETVRRRLAENALKPWQRKMWCIPKLDAQYVARMEDVLDLYAEPADRGRPVVCFDEASVQLTAEVRTPQAAAPGRPERIDYEYERRGTVNLFMHFDPTRAWRHVKVTARRAGSDFAACMRELWSMCTTRGRKRSASCSTTCPRTRRRRFMSAGRRPRRAACCGGWSFTTRPSTQAG